MMLLTTKHKELELMKKIVIVSVLLGAMGIGGAIALSSNLIGSADDSDIISMAEAEKKALEAVNGKIVEIEKEKEGTKIFYEIEVETKDAEYELKIDALSGEIVKKTKGPLTANTGVPKDDDDDDDQDDMKSNTQNSNKHRDDLDDRDDDDDKKQVRQTPTEKTTTHAPAATSVQKQQSPAPVTSPKKHDDDDDDRYDDDWDDDDRDDDDDDRDDDDDDDDRDDD